MQKKKGKITPENLRENAEKEMEIRADWTEDLSDMSSVAMGNLIYELRVHQVELNIQNEELRRIQVELEEARDRYSHLYDFSPVGHITINEKGIIVEVNLKMTTMVGIERQSLMGSLFSRYIVREDQDIFYYLKKCLIHAKKNQSARLRMIQKGGEFFYANLECEMIEKRDGMEKQTCMVISDISEQKELEKQLLESQKMEAIGTLAGGIAHDFNNILTAIIGFAEFAKEDAEPGSSLSDSLEEILIGGNRAKLLVQQIMTFCRKTSQKRIPLRLDQLVREAARLLKSTLTADIEIHVTIQSENPFIIGDESQIHQVILNLCTNAVQAMKTHGGTLTITISEVKLDLTMANRFIDLIPGEYLTISISDTGSGIPPEVKNRIFEPFFSTKDLSEGTGLGLAVVKGIVTSHKGYIAVSSYPGNGTIFTVYLPQIGHIERFHEEPQQKELPHGKEHILFVDDERSLVKLYKAELEKLGYTVTVKTSSLEALDSFRSDPKTFDIVITDMNMPDMPGDQLVRELLSIRENLPVILCTGYSEKITKELTEEIGIKAFHYKPVNKTLLAVMIRKILDEVTLKGEPPAQS